MCLLGSNKDDPPNWFELGMGKKVGSGVSTSFWGDPWLGSISLKIKFQRFFSISQIQNVTMGEVGRCNWWRIT